jgi:hypothetical protein
MPETNSRISMIERMYMWKEIAALIAALFVAVYTGFEHTFNFVQASTRQETVHGWCAAIEHRCVYSWNYTTECMKTRDSLPREVSEQLNTTIADLSERSREDMKANCTLEIRSMRKLMEAQHAEASEQHKQMMALLVNSAAELVNARNGGKMDSDQLKQLVEVLDKYNEQIKAFNNLTSRNEQLQADLANEVSAHKETNNSLVELKSWRTHTLMLINLSLTSHMRGDWYVMSAWAVMNFINFSGIVPWYYIILAEAMFALLIFAGKRIEMISHFFKKIHEKLVSSLRACAEFFAKRLKALGNWFTRLRITTIQPKEEVAEAAETTDTNEVSEETKRAAAKALESVKKRISFISPGGPSSK